MIVAREIGPSSVPWAPGAMREFPFARLLPEPAPETPAVIPSTSASAADLAPVVSSLPGSRPGFVRPTQTVSLVPEFVYQPVRQGVSGAGDSDGSLLRFTGFAALVGLAFVVLHIWGPK